MANLKIELSKLDSEAWPGALDIEKEKLMLINEKEELLKELQFITPQRRTQDELESLDAERQRLEEELLSVRGAPSRALAERCVLLPGWGVWAVGPPCISLLLGNPKRLRPEQAGNQYERACLVESSRVHPP